MLEQQAESSAEPSLVARDLRKRFAEKEVVCGISFTLGRGQVLGLLGPNGAGKTTTLGMLYGSVIPSGGSAELYPERLPLSSKAARQHLGIVTQNNNLDPDFSVLDNLLLFARLYRIGAQSARVRADELLELVGLTEYASFRIEQLSGGLQRRLVLARALLSKPRIVLLDEPTTGFDPDARQEFWKIIFRLKEAGTSVLLTTHYMDEAERLCDRLLLLQAGKVVDEGKPLELINRIVGAEMIEVVGVAQESLEQILNEVGATDKRPLPFSNGFLIPSSNAPAALWEALARQNPTRLSKRQSNLEDVFLVLTGARLYG